MYLAMSNASQREAIKAREAARVNREAQIMSAILAARSADAAFLAARITDELDSKHASNHERIVDLLWSFAEIKSGYVQVRFLDSRGRESVRVDNTPEGARLAPDGQFQDKSQTAYFQKGTLLPFGSVSVSRFDLNVERGEIEIPLLPVLRFSSPVLGADGSFAGIVVLNLNGEVIRERLRQAASAALGRPLLVNADGYWLVGPTPEEEWGFQLRERSELTVQSAWPGTWERIRSQERGQFLLDGALYTFDVVQADSTIGITSSSVMIPEEGWKIVARVPKERLAPPLNTVFIVMTVGLAVFLGGLSWLWASGRAKRDMIQAELADSESQFRAMSEASQDALVMTDDQGRVAFWNRAAERMFGVSRQDMEGRPLHDVVAPADELDKARVGLRDFKQTGDGAVINEIGEYVARRGDGSPFPVELSVAAFRRDDRWWAVGSARDISERKRAEEALRELATTDGLTGLLNRRRFVEMGEAEIERTKRTGRPLSLIMFDVDHFKKVNDTFGHGVGDMVLVALARTATDALRAVDILGRLGGEEFAAILPETGLGEAADVAERLRRAVADMGLAPNAEPLPVRISLGVVQGQGAGETLDDLLRRADTALYKAKSAGRDRVEQG
ncbi:sensor domain-containing diguanylate cyclase [Desulfolutivibrio sp.]|uniref:sensor domain-containing diguanylate cyclase n=1 Tax=Desulfolutivibrio sp. TaxID=2773296 RepID=UPI002F9681C0